MLIILKYDIYCYIYTNVTFPRAVARAVESSSDWRSSSRDHRATAAGETSQTDDDDEDDDDDDVDDDDDDDDELVRRVLCAGGLRPSSASGGLRRTERELMADREHVTSAAGADHNTSELTGVVSNLREKVCLLCFYRRL